MSRTYRRTMLELDCNCGAPIEHRITWGKNGYHESIAAELRWANSRGVPPERVCECGVKYDYYSKRNKLG